MSISRLPGAESLAGTTGRPVVAIMAVMGNSEARRLSLSPVSDGKSVPLSFEDDRKSRYTRGGRGCVVRFVAGCWCDRWHESVGSKSWQPQYSRPACRSTRRRGGVANAVVAGEKVAV